MIQIVKKINVAFLSFFMVLVSLTMVYANSEEAVSLLVLPFDNATKEKGNDVLENGIADLLIAYLSPYSNKIKVIDRDMLEHVSEEFGIKDYTVKENQVKLGELTQSQFIVRGSFLKDAKFFELTGIVYETESSRVVKTFSVDKINSLNSSVGALAAQIAEFFETKITQYPELLIEEDPQRSLSMIYGLGHYHNQQYPRALAQFMDILEKNFDDEDARYWLGKTFLASGMGDHAKVEFEKFVKDHSGSLRINEIQKELKRMSGSKEINLNQ